MDWKQIGAVVAMVVIGVLGAIALFEKIDGAVFATVIATIAGLGGYSLTRAK